MWGTATACAVQNYLNKIGYHLIADGSRGPATFKALQRLLGTTQAGVIFTPSQMVKALQRVLNSGKQWL